MRERIAYILAALALGASPAAAATETGVVKLSIDIGDKGKHSCSVAVEPDTEKTGVTMRATITKNKKFEPVKTLTEYTYVLVLKGQETLLKAVAKNAFAELSGSPVNTLSALEGGILELRKGSETLCKPVIAQETPAEGSCRERREMWSTSPTISTYFADNPKVLTRQVGEEGVRTGRTYVVTNLPNGQIPRKRTAIPADLSERDTFRLVAVVPRATSVKFTIDECDSPPFYRVLHVPKASAGDAQRGDEDIVRSPDVPKEVWFDHDLRCATRLKYTITLTSKDCGSIDIQHTFSTLPVYDFFLGAGFGYDFGSQVKYSKKTSVNDPAVPSVLDRDRETAGFKPVITLSWFPFGANPKRWRLQDHFAPFLGFDPSRADEGAIAGINWAFASGLGILTGVSVFKTETLSEPRGLDPGEGIPKDVEIKTNKRFNSDGVSFFIGANFTTDVFQQLFEAVSQGLGSGNKKTEPPTSGTGGEGEEKKAEE